MDQQIDVGWQVRRKPTGIVSLETPMRLRRRAGSRHSSLFWGGVFALLMLFLAFAFEGARGAGDQVWAWNQTDLSEFSGQLSAYQVVDKSTNQVVCSDYNASNLYIGVTEPVWVSEQNFEYSGVIEFGGLGSRAGVTLYYQDPGNLYQVNIQSGDNDPFEGGFRLRRFNEGHEHQLIEDNSLHFIQGTWYSFHLTVETYPDHTHFHLIMNDETGPNALEYDDYSSDRFTSGRVGLRKKQGPQACWDDLAVDAVSGLPATITSTQSSESMTPTPTNSAATATNPSGGGGRMSATPSPTPGPGTPTATSDPGGGGRMSATPSPTPGPGTPTSTSDPGGGGRATLTASNTPAPGTPTATFPVASPTATSNDSRPTPTDGPSPTLFATRAPN